MPSLQSLNLADCRFTSIDFNISTNSFGKLKFLDLSGNRLLSLSSQFILYSMDKGIQLKLPIYSKTNTLLATIATIPPTANIAAANRAISLKASTNVYNDPETPRFEKKTSTTPSTTSPTTPTFDTDNTTVTETEVSPMDDDFSTPHYVDLTTIMCLNSAKDTVTKLAMTCDGMMTIQNQAESTVKIVIFEVNIDDWALVYFSNQSVVSCVDSQVASAEPMGDISLTVRDLSCATSYVFCLLYENKTSPLNCKSHHTLACENIVSRSSWFEENSVLIISMGIVGILLFVAVGGIVMYAILWHRPTWLCGSSRLKRAARDSLTMLLLPLNYENNIYCAIRKENGGDAISDYMTYYRHLEQTKLSDTESNEYNIPPQESAPPAPNPKGHAYESFDLYEELI
ncbi:hypothetical protein KR093_002155 [Drosophila rubida]|uniref:Uncharacterized protein n=1 Tax=Drosophila rubida TaxID=30044 RepID=A0AAD4JS93_9MUSC|nr:hypothetical protein KR093_002155 [Drosophila rubida]